MSVTVNKQVLKLCWGSAVLRACTVSNCVHDGVSAHGEGSRLEMHACKLHQNRHAGDFASTDEMVEVSGCSSRWNKRAGYRARCRGQMTVRNSSSVGDEKG